MIRQELNPETCRLDTKQRNERCILRIIDVLLNDFHVQERHQKIHRRRGFDKIIQIHRRHGSAKYSKKSKYCRRHGFGENAEEGSDAAELIVNDQHWFQIATTVQQIGQLVFWGLLHVQKILQVRDSTESWSDSWIQPKWIASLGNAAANMCSAPPATRFKKGEDRRKKKREVLHLLRCYTHTPGQSRVNPERQEEEKSGHTKGKRPKTAQGGEGNRRTSGTNLHGETDLIKTAHTPKPHDTLRRGTRGN